MRLPHRGAHVERIYFATNRNLIENRDGRPEFGSRPNNQGAAALRFGVATTADDDIHLEVSPESLVPDASGLRLDYAKSKLGSLQVFSEMRSQMTADHTDTIIFVHGFNVTFREALSSALKMQRNFSSIPVNVALFSWPSDGSMAPWLAYASDRDDAKASGPALARAILELAKYLRRLTAAEACGRELHLVAHSMGNYVLRHAVQKMISEHGSHLPHVFEHIFLMAADEDDDTFEHAYKLRLLPNLATQVHVYFNRGDLSMHVSDRTKGNPPRLGADGVRVPGALPGKVNQIDCSDVVDGLLEHSYYLQQESVVDDMAAVLRGQAPDAIENRRFRADKGRYVIAAPAGGHD